MYIYNVKGKWHKPIYLIELNNMQSLKNIYIIRYEWLDPIVWPITANSQNIKVCCSSETTISGDLYSTKEYQDSLYPTVVCIT